MVEVQAHLEPTSTSNSFKLTADEFNLFLKVLGFMATVCTDIEIRDSMIHNKTNDKVVTFVLSLPTTEKINIKLINIANAVKILKTFSGNDVTVTQDENYYNFVFGENQIVSFRKPSILTNPFNKDKVDAILKVVELETIPISSETLNTIRSLSNKFGTNVLVDLENGLIEMESTDNNVKYKDKLDVSDVKNKVIFSIHQHALPSVPFTGNATLSFGLYQVPTSGNTFAFYKIDATIEIAGKILPFSSIGMSSLGKEE